MIKDRARFAAAAVDFSVFLTSKIVSGAYTFSSSERTGCSFPENELAAV
jgi:hypothetical protein